MGAARAFIPYARHEVTEEDAKAVREALFSERLTTGASVAAFEEAFAERVGAKYAVSFNSGTAALHAAAWSAGVGPGDEAITTPLTFASTANVLAHLGCRPLFADVDPATLTLSPISTGRLITERTRALLPVDYAGHPAPIDEFMKLAAKRDLVVIEDACHSLGAFLGDKPVGNLAHLTAFSFHPVKHITTGEGGMCVTDDGLLARRMRAFRTHGVDLDADARAARGVLGYDIAEPGFNYRMPDLNAALGLSQLRRLGGYVERRREIAALYGGYLSGIQGLTLPVELPHCRSSYHLYPVRFAGGVRDRAAALLKERGIGTSFHYPPLHLMTFYREKFGCAPGDCPIAEGACGELLSLPLFPTLTDREVKRVADAVLEVLSELGR